MPKKEKKEEENSVIEEEEEDTKEVKKKGKEGLKKKKEGKKNQKVTSTPVKNNKVSKKEKGKKSKKNKKEDNEENEGEEENDDIKEEKGKEKKKGKKKNLIKKELKQVKKEIASLSKKVNKQAYRKYFEIEARNVKYYDEIQSNIDILLQQLELYEESTKRKSSYRYIRPEVVKFINKNPISSDQPKFKPDDSGLVVGNKVTISKVLHAYLKSNCECIRKEDGKSRSAFACISYKLDKNIRGLLDPIYKELEIAPIQVLPFSGVSGVVSNCQYNDVNVLKEDIEKYKEINEWFANYKAPKPKGEPKKRGRKPKSEEEKKEGKKKKEKKNTDEDNKKKTKKKNKKKKDDEESEDN